MISEFKHIEAMFKEIDKELRDKIKVYTIGGAVLMHEGIKPATKDIDMIVETEKDFIALQRCLERLDFKLKVSGKPYSHMNISQIFQKGDFRIDLFHKKVCGKFSLSKRMIKRAKEVLGLSNIKIFFCANEDIFVFKTMTEREGDIEDCISLSKKGIDWGIIIDELKGQLQESKNDLWITWIGERLDILEKKGLVIPIKKDIDRMVVEYYNWLDKKSKSKKL